MKKLLALLLVGFLGLQSISFAATPAEQKADQLKVIVKMILDQSKNKEKDTTMIKTLFAGCEKTCSDPVVKEAVKILNSTFDQDFGTKEEKKTELLSYTLLEVVDGDTIRVKNSEGKEQSVRMIGLDAPESTTMRYGYAECFGKEAADHLKTLVGSATQIQIETDPTQTATDKYGRLLGYVVVNGANLNQKMIEDGYGFEYTYNLPYRYQSEFKSAQKTASEKKFGLWADDACKGERSKIENEKEEKKSDSNAEKMYHRGPKGGCYYFTDKGEKEYVDKAFCR
ncbi:MAG: thermonuclease family protein [bacterium]|nr:thermonuclease family protein [bacterium]